MIRIFIDFEMNPVHKSYKEIRQISRHEIVEVGAVKLDDDLNVIDRFSTYVKPSWNSIESFITRLTGITDDAVKDAPDFETAIWDLHHWIDARDEKVKLYQWSDNDRIQFLNQCQLYDINLDQMGVVFHHWTDFQRMYYRRLGIRRVVNLETAVGIVRMGLNGNMHRALDDAENAAKLMRIFNDKSEFESRTKSVREAFQPQKATFTIGSLFSEKLMALGA